MFALGLLLGFYAGGIFFMGIGTLWWTRHIDDGAIEELSTFDIVLTLVFWPYYLYKVLN